MDRVASFYKLSLSLSHTHTHIHTHTHWPDAHLGLGILGMDSSETRGNEGLLDEGLANSNFHMLTVQS